MTDTTSSRPAQGEPADPSNVAVDPPSRLARNILGVFFCGLSALTFYLLVATWPVPASGNKGGFAEFSLFGWGEFSPPADLRLFFTVIAAGALGSLIHTLTSFADFAGNRTLSRNWTWWFILRTPIGIALALMFYFVLRGGLMAPGPATDATQLVNPYGIAGVSALAGMFSKQATDKLREIFDTLFQTRAPVNRADPLTRTIPTISSTQPPKLTVGAALTLDVIGSGFLRNCTATINGEERKGQWVTESLLKLTLESKDVAAAGQLKLVVRNPGPAGGRSEAFPIQVEA
jgi:hypothetical protein